MKEEQWRFLTLLHHVPARMTVEQAAWLLNCQAHDIPILVAARLLRPLGNAPPNSVKYFAAPEVLELTKERTWLVKVTNALNDHWRQRNARRKPCLGTGSIDRDSRVERAELSQVG